MTVAIRNTKQKRHKFQSTKKNIQGTHQPLIRVGRKRKRGVVMKAAIQKTKQKTQVSIIEEKYSRYTPPTNQVWEEKEEGSNDESSYSKHKIRVTQVSTIKENIQGTHHPLIRVGKRKKSLILRKAAIQNTK